MVPLEMPPAAAPDLKAKLLARVRADGAGRLHGSRPAASKVARRRIGWAMPLAAAALALLAIATYREIGWRAERARLDSRARSPGADDRQPAARPRSRRGDFAKVSAALAQRENDVASLRAALAKAEESLSIVQRPGLNLVALKETKDAPPAAGHILLSAPTGKALFYAFDLPPVPRRQDLRAVVDHGEGRSGPGRPVPSRRARPRPHRDDRPGRRRCHSGRRGHHRGRRRRAQAAGPDGADRHRRHAELVTWRAPRRRRRGAGSGENRTVRLTPPPARL